MKTFSIIIPVYYNELNLPETIPQLLGFSQEMPGYHLELVFVNDGSGDRSLEILLEYRSRDPETIKVVNLTRNFGSMAAIQAPLQRRICADPRGYLEAMDHRHFVFQ